MLECDWMQSERRNYNIVTADLDHDSQRGGGGASYHTADCFPGETVLTAGRVCLVCMHTFVCITESWANSHPHPVFKHEHTLAARVLRSSFSAPLWLFSSSLNVLPSPMTAFTFYPPHNTPPQPDLPNRTENGRKVYFISQVEDLGHSNVGKSHILSFFFLFVFLFPSDPY